MLDDGGLLVLIEAGNPKGSHIVRSARQFILDSFGGSMPTGGEDGIRVKPVLPPPLQSEDM